MLIVRARHTHSTSAAELDTIGGGPLGSAANRILGNRASYAPRTGQTASAGVRIDLERYVHTDTGSVHQLDDASDFASPDRISAIESKDVTDAI